MIVVNKNQYTGKNTKAIDEFNQMAQDMGMTYGQYSAYLYQQRQAELRRKETDKKCDAVCG